MVDWHVGDVIINKANRVLLPHLCYTDLYFEAYAPDGTFRGTINPTGLPARDPCVAAFQYKMVYRKGFIYIGYASAGPVYNLVRINKDGTGEIVPTTIQNYNNNFGVDFDKVGNLYHYAGIDPVTGVHELKKLSTDFTLLNTYTYDPFTDPNITGLGYAATLRVTRNGTIAYFSETEMAPGTFVSGPPFYINRLDLLTGTSLSPIVLNESADFMLPFDLDKAGNLWIPFKVTAGNSFYMIQIDSLGNKLNSFNLSPIDPNFVGNIAEIDDVALSNKQDYIWTMETGGPLTAYDNNGNIVHRVIHPTPADNTITEFAITVVLSSGNWISSTLIGAN